MNFDLSELTSVLGRKSRRKPKQIIRYSPPKPISVKSKSKSNSVKSKSVKSKPIKSKSIPKTISKPKLFNRPLTTIVEYAKKNRMTSEQEDELSKLFGNITAKGKRHRSKRHRSKRHRSKRHRSKRHRSKRHRSKRHRSKRHRSKRHRSKRHRSKRHRSKKH